KQPFPMSPISAIAARHLLETRRTLLKPGFFEPTLVISMPVPSIAIFANGIEPIRNAASIFRANVILFDCCGLLDAARYRACALCRACIRSRSCELVAEISKHCFPRSLIGALFDTFRGRTVDHSHDSAALFALRNDDFEGI